MKIINNVYINLLNVKKYILLIELTLFFIDNYVFFFKIFFLAVISV